VLWSIANEPESETEAAISTTSGIMRVGGNRKGVFIRDRQPKAAAFALRRRWRTDP
jgi:beta-glucuronidase